jgi:hypothetical protein
MISYFIWQLIASAGVSASLSGLLIWITKSWLSERLSQSIRSEYNQRLETHKAQLKASSDVEIERLRSQLNISATEHQVRYAKMHETRAEVIAETYSLLKELYICLADYIKVFEPAGDEARAQRRERAYNALTKFKSYYPVKLIFLPSDVADQLAEIDRELTMAFNEFFLGVERAQAAGSEDVSMWIKIIDRINAEIQPACKSLEAEFRKLIGSEG